MGLRMGDFGKGFIHVMDEVSFPILLRHLDTICDLIITSAQNAALSKPATARYAPVRNIFWPSI